MSTKKSTHYSLRDRYTKQDTPNKIHQTRYNTHTHTHTKSDTRAHRETHERPTTRREGQTIVPHVLSDAAQTRAERVQGRETIHDGRTDGRSTGGEQNRGEQNREGENRSRGGPGVPVPRRALFSSLLGGGRRADGSSGDFRFRGGFRRDYRSFHQ